MYLLYPLRPMVIRKQNTRVYGGKSANMDYLKQLQDELKQMMRQTIHLLHHQQEYLPRNGTKYLLHWSKNKVLREIKNLPKNKAKQKSTTTCSNNRCNKPLFKIRMLLPEGATCFQKPVVRVPLNVIVGKMHVQIAICYFRWVEVDGKDTQNMIEVVKVKLLNPKTCWYSISVYHIIFKEQNLKFIILRRYFLSTE